MWQRYRDQGVVVVGLNPSGLRTSADSENLLTQFKEQAGVTFPLGWPTDDSFNTFRLASGPSISPFPLDVIIDRQGKVRYVNSEYEAAEQKAVIEQLLAEGQ